VQNKEEKIKEEQDGEGNGKIKKKEDGDSKNMEKKEKKY
jgi:hypothetical protein